MNTNSAQEDAGLMKVESAGQGHLDSPHRTCVKTWLCSEYIDKYGGIRKAKVKMTSSEVDSRDCVIVKVFVKTD